MNENLKKINKLKSLIKKHEKEYNAKEKELEELHEADNIGGDEMLEELEKLKNLHHSKELELQEKLQTPKPWKPIDNVYFDIDSRLFIRAKLVEYYHKIKQFFKSTDLQEKVRIWNMITEDASDVLNELEARNHKTLSSLLNNMNEQIEELQYIKEGEL